MTRIEILNITDRTVRVAFYYPVPTPSPDTLGRGQVPSGTRLTAQEVTDLRDAKIVELVKTVDLSGVGGKAAARTLLESLWSAHASEAETFYANTYKNSSFIGLAWDGSTWS